MSQMLPHLKAFRALADALDYFLPTEMKEGEVPLVMHGLACSLRRAADELERAMLDETRAGGPS